MFTASSFSSASRPGMARGMRAAFDKSNSCESDDDDDIGFGWARPTFDTRIPSRHRPPTMDANSEIPKARTMPGRHTAEKVKMKGGPVPDMHGLTEEQYIRFVRDGFEYLKRQREEKEAERERAERIEREHREWARAEKRKAEEEREERKRQRTERTRREERARAAYDEDASGSEPEMIFVRHHAPPKPDKSALRQRYTKRWTALTDTGGEIEETEIRYNDIPWPTYSSLDKASVLEFMKDLSADTNQQLKKTLRSAIREYHPDRFFGRILPRVAEQDKEKVKEGVETCSRLINNLASEL